MMKNKEVEIRWKYVAYFKKTGHGVEIYYNPDPDNLDLDGDFRGRNNLVAFVVDFSWWHGMSDGAEVRVLRSDSPTYVALGADSDKVVEEIKHAVGKYVPRCKAFPHIHMVPEDKLKNKSRMSDPIGKHLTVWVNG